MDKQNKSLWIRNISHLPFAFEGNRSLKKRFWRSCLWWQTVAIPSPLPCSTSRLKMDKQNTIILVFSLLFLLTYIIHIFLRYHELHFSFPFFPQLLHVVKANSKALATLAFTHDFHYQILFICISVSFIMSLFCKNI